MIQTKVKATDHPLQYQEAHRGMSCAGWLSTRRIRASPTAEPALAVNGSLKEAAAMPSMRPVTPEAGLPDEVYEGTVRLDVDSEGGILQLVHFVRQLGELPQVRLLRLVGNHQVMEILLSLREPLTLKDTLAQIRAVTAPSACDLQGDTGKTTPPHRALGVRNTARLCFGPRYPGLRKGAGPPFAGVSPTSRGPETIRG